MANEVLITKINELNEERKTLKAQQSDISDRLAEIDELIQQAIEVLLSSEEQLELPVESKEAKVQRIISR